VVEEVIESVSARIDLVLQKIAGEERDPTIPDHQSAQEVAEEVVEEDHTLQEEDAQTKAQEDPIDQEAVQEDQAEADLRTAEDLRIPENQETVDHAEATLDQREETQLDQKTERDL
jgi:hypothetical protein